MASLAAPALAGQLHIQWFGLAEIASGDGYALHARVDATDPKANKLTVTVLRGWARDDVTAPSGTFDAAIYGGVEWTDPRESPIDRRFVGSMQVTGVKVGAEVLLVPLGGKQWEFAAWTKDSTRKLDAFFADGGPPAYRKRSKRAQLEADLADFDLHDPAYKELVERKQLTAKALIAASASHLL